MTSNDLAAGAAGTILPSFDHFRAYSFRVAKYARCQSVRKLHIKILEVASPSPN